MSTFEQFQAVKSRGATPAAGDAGVPMIGIRKDTPADLAGADGKYTMPQFDAGGNMRATVVSKAAIVAVAMQRPANTTAYVAGNMWGATAANSSSNIFTMPVSRVPDGSVIISRIRAKVQGSINWAGKRLKFHLFKDIPTVTTIGDGGAFANGSVGTESRKIGTVTITLDSVQTSDGYVKGFSYPDDTAGVFWIVEPSSTTVNIFAIAEVVDDVTPGSGDTLTLALEVAEQN